MEIYRHGMPAAILMPVKTRGRERLSTNKPLNIPGVSLSQAILTERDEKQVKIFIERKCKTRHVLIKEKHV